jgi:acyl-CoA thioesterase
VKSILNMEIVNNMAEYEGLAPRFKEALMKWQKTKNPFWSLLGMELVAVKKGWAKIRLPFSDKLANGIGVAHGGAIFSPADSAAGMALVGLLDKDEAISTPMMHAAVTFEIREIRPLADFGQGWEKSI